MVGKVIACVECFFPEYVEQARREVKELVREAYLLADEVYGLEAAALWAGGYRIPKEMVQADVDKFRRVGNSVEAMARAGRKEKGE